MNQQVSMILTLVNDLMDLAKIEQFKFTLHEGYFDLSKLIRQVCQTMRPLANDRNVKLQADFKVSFSLHANNKKEEELMSYR